MAEWYEFHRYTDGKFRTELKVTIPLTLEEISEHLVIANFYYITDNFPPETFSNNEFSIQDAYRHWMYGKFTSRMMVMKDVKKSIEERGASASVDDYSLREHVKVTEEWLRTTLWR